MPPDEDEQDNQFAALLADYDEAIARGRIPVASDTAVDETLRRRVVDAEECLAFLEAAWPRNGKSKSEQAAATTSFWETQPATIGRFVVERKLGQGGQGFVFLAFDPLLRRMVAIKVPRPEFLVDD